MVLSEFGLWREAIALLHQIRTYRPTAICTVRSSAPPTVLADECAHAVREATIVRRPSLELRRRAGPSPRDCPWSEMRVALKCTLSSAVQVRPPVRRFFVVQRQGSLRCVALRALLPDPPSPAARGPDGPRPRTRGLGGEGRRGRSGAKFCVSEARYVAMVRTGVSAPNGIRHCERNACPTRPWLRVNLTVELDGVRATPL